MIDAAFKKLEIVDHRARPQETGRVQAVACQVIVGSGHESQNFLNLSGRVRSGAIRVPAEYADGWSGPVAVPVGAECLQWSPLGLRR